MDSHVSAQTWYNFCHSYRVFSWVFTLLCSFLLLLLFTAYEFNLASDMQQCTRFLLFFFFSLGNYLCSPLSTLHSQASCNSLEKRFSALSLESGNRTGSGFRLLFSLLELKKVPILTECTAYPLQIFISLYISVPALSCVVCSGGMAKCCAMPTSTAWKVTDHISSKGSAPLLQGDFGQTVLFHFP